MASFMNSFALLEGDVTADHASTGKKKKSKKAKQVASAVPLAAPGDASATQAPAPQKQSAEDDGFQVAGKMSRRNSTSSSKPSSALASPRQRSGSEEITALMSSASRVPVKHSAERVELWTSWQQQCKAADSEGSEERAAFKQMLLTSKALDITARRCLSSPFPSKPDLAALSQLLSAVLPPTVQQSAIQAFVTALHELVKAVPASSSADVSKAQEAVGTVIACLKEPQPVTESSSSAHPISAAKTERAHALTHEIGHLQYKLAGDGIPDIRERLMATQHVAELCDEHFRLLQRQQGTQPPEGKTAQALKTLDDLILTAADMRMGEKSKAGGAQSAAADHSTQDLADIRSQIQECEQRLALLRQQEREVAGRQAAPKPQQQKPQAVHANGISTSDSSAMLAGLGKLRDALVQGSASAQVDPSSDQSSELAVLQKKVLASYISNHEDLISASCKVLQELEEKVRVMAIKLAKAVKTGRDLQLLNMKKEDVAVNQQHQQNYQKQVKDLMSSASEIHSKACTQYGNSARTQQLKQAGTNADQLDRITVSFEVGRDAVQTAYNAVIHASTGRSREPSPKATPAVSLSQADPVVQPSASPAGAIGTSSTSGQDGIARGRQGKLDTVSRVHASEQQDADQHANGSVHPQNAEGEDVQAQNSSHLHGFQTTKDRRRHRRQG